jgi:hypothetical protein
MPPSWTTEQILALAPDAGSVKAGKELAVPRKWLSFGQNEQAAWGECQGSGKNPYQTEIDLSEPAFRCTCPSRKFPCKHALGLFLLLASQPAAFTETEPPGWVADWLVSRAVRAEQRTQKEERGGAVVDTAAQARRAAERERRVATGVAELELWLRDLLRHGLAAAQSQPYSFWETPAARMVDAQAPGIARLIREMAGIPATGEGWQERLLERLGRLHLLLEGFKQLDKLPPATQADVRAMIGWTQSQEELLNEAGLRDEWLVLGQRVEEEERLRVHRTWLWGRESGRAALLLQFAHGSQPLDVSLVTGTALDADLVFFPGAYLLRALVKDRHRAPERIDQMPGYATISAAIEAYAAALARNPWLERFPLPLQAVIPFRRDGRWMARDATGQTLPLAPRFARGWHLLALSGGHPFGLLGEWDGEQLLPLTIEAGGQFYRVAKADA